MSVCVARGPTLTSRDTQLALQLQPQHAEAAGGLRSRGPLSRRGPPAVTEPPGEFTYMVTSSLPVESRYSSCATIRLAMSSSTGPPMRTMRCTHYTCAYIRLIFCVTS